MCANAGNALDKLACFHSQDFVILASCISTFRLLFFYSRTYVNCGTELGICLEGSQFLFLFLLI